MELRLSLGSIDDEHSVSAGAVATVRLIAGSNGDYVPDGWCWTGSVPISSNNAKAIALPQLGFYKAEVTLPSGQLLSRHIHIIGKDGADLRFQPKIPSSAFVDDDLVEASSRSPSVGLTHSSDTYFLKGAPARASTPSVASKTKTKTDDQIILLRVSEPYGPHWQDLVKFGSFFGVQPYDAKEKLFKRYPRVEDAPDLKAVRSTLPHIWLIEGELDLQGKRTFAAVRLSDRTNLVSIPQTRHRSGPTSDTTLEFFARNYKSEFCVTVVLRDEILDGLLAYLGTGNLAAATMILKDLKNDVSWSRLLNEPHSNLVATVAAYILSAGGEREVDHKLEWDLAWLPDKLILRARDRLRYARSETDLEVAKRGFIEAYRAGLPYIAAGVAYLAEGLSLFADDDDIRAMARSVASARARIDPSQVFTVVKLG